MLTGNKNYTTAFLLFSLFLLPVQGFGQDNDERDSEEENVFEEVIVTGSRLIKSALDSPSPVTVYTAKDLIDTGVTTVEEFARYLPQNNDTFSEAMTSNSTLRGTASFNLRGIGLDGTLTLLNGRRVAPFGGSGDSFPFVDINSIPVAAIDRIEVLKDGASAIYGSEAVAGVVNIITRKQVEGFTVAGGYMSTAEGDGEEWDVAVTGGWSGTSTNITGTLSYFNRELIWTRDREFASDVDFSDKGGFNSRSSLGSPPSATGLDPDTGQPMYLLADPECPADSAINSLDVIVPGIIEICRFNYAQFTTMQSPSERLGVTANLEHDFGNGLMLFAELLYSNNLTKSVAAPTPLFNQIVAPDHPDNPFGDWLALRMRALDTGDRFLETDSISTRAVAGMRGYLSDWEWEAALMHSKSEADSMIFNALLSKEFQEALFGLAGPNGDQFYNPFGLNTQNSQEVIDHFLVSNVGNVQTNEETTLDFQISGEFWALPGGPVGAAFGTQARRQTLKQVVDDEFLFGKIAGGGGFDPIGAERDIYSAFAEVLLPLNETFEVQLAVRYDDYSDFGSTTNPKIGLGWRPVQEVLVRATWGTSFRPPTFRELFDPKVEGIGFIGDDPHRCPVTGDPFDCQGRATPFVFQGNPDLQPDEGETFLVGIAWEPSFAQGLTLQVDYWSIEHTDRIELTGNLPLAGILFKELDPFTNPFTVRQPQTPEDVALGIPGIVILTLDSYANAGRIDTNGVDLDLNYVLDSNSGMWTTTLSYTYLNEYKFGSDFMGIQFSEDFAGGYGFNSGLPQHRANLRLGWNRNAHGASALITYAGEFNSFAPTVVDGRATDIPFVIDDYTQLDLQYSYVFARLRDSIVRIGCRNCADADPPLYNASNLTQPFHEGRGVMFYLRWDQPFF